MSLDITRNARKSERRGDVEAESSDVDNVTPPPAKRFKQATKRAPCLLLDFGPEIMRNILSFLKLKDGLEVPRTCRRLHNEETSNNVFRYCYIQDPGVCVYKYIRNQYRILCNPISLDNLHSVLRNETLPADVSECFVQSMAEHSTTDNAQAMEILLQDSRCEVSINDLDKLLKKDYTNMAAVLQEHKDVKEHVRICGLCKANVGCYDCANDEEEAFVAHQCVMGASNTRYCRQCVLNDNRFCRCMYYLCQECHLQENYVSCVECDQITCFHYDCSDWYIECRECDRTLCERCYGPDTGWESFLFVDDDDVMDGDLFYLCPSCREE